MFTFQKNFFDTKELNIIKKKEIKKLDHMIKTNDQKD